MRGQEHDLLWNQIEAEIHLHRHKTVIRACRNKIKVKDPVAVPEVAAPPVPEIEHGDDAATISRKRRGIGEIRVVEIHREKSEGFGISITVSSFLSSIIF